MTRLLLRLGALLAAVLLTLGVLAAVPSSSSAQAPQRRDNPPACVDCHGADLGGRVLIDDLVVGRIVAPNLTSGAGGLGDAYDLDALRTAIISGQARDGRRLILMPVAEFGHYGAGEVAMISTGILRAAPVDRVLPPRRLGPIGRALQDASPDGLLAEVIETRLRSGAPAPEPGTPAYGPYLAAVGCAPCHGASLRGATIGRDRQAPDLGPDGPLGRWTEAEFVTALRTGVRPDGRAMGGDMPVHALRDLDEGSLKALWATLRALPEKIIGGMGRR